jgi:uncharacterized protein (TIGR00369 family)
MAEPAFKPLNPDYAARVRDSFARQPMMAHVGATLAAIGPGTCEIHLPYRRELTQQHGYVHGGALATIVDSAAGYAAFSLMPADASILTIEYKLNILRPGEGELMIARGRVIKPGRSLSVVNADVYAVKGGVETLCVTSIHTLMVMHGKADDTPVR